MSQAVLAQVPVPANEEASPSPRDFASAWDGMTLDVSRAEHRRLRASVEDVLTDFMEFDVVEYMGGVFPLAFLVSHAEDIRTADSLPSGVLEGTSPGEGEEAAELADFWKQVLARIAGAEAQASALFEDDRSKGMVRMENVHLLFPQGTDAAYTHPSWTAGGTVRSIQVRQTFFGPVVEVELGVYHVLEGDVRPGRATFRIGGWKGAAPIAELPLRAVERTSPPEDATRAGAAALRFARPGSYASYAGDIVQESRWSHRSYAATGRVIVDSVRMRQLAPDEWRDCLSATPLNLDSRANENVVGVPAQVFPEADAWKVWPWVYGFSMRAKQWGKIHALGLSPIQWRGEAFDLLVMEQGVKDTLRDLVSHHGGGFSDIVSDKGGGLIVLLEGEPGQGKTLTAEAVAEVLQRPLYSIGVGELGTNVNQLEQALRTILDVAQSWNAVVLLDEVDIFLEKRDTRDIGRNAMVAVFLRLLEYHDGVLFLTSNRAANLDPAFASRISVRMSFPHGDRDKQRRVLANLLGRAGLSAQAREAIMGVELPDMNAREIKSLIRHAMTLARAKGREAGPDDFRAFLALRSVKL